MMSHLKSYEVGACHTWTAQVLLHRCLNRCAYCCMGLRMKAHDVAPEELRGRAWLRMPRRSVAAHAAVPLAGLLRGARGEGAQLSKFSLPGGVVDDE